MQSMGCNNLRPEEALKRLEIGIREVLTGMAESRQAFGSSEIKNERKVLTARLNLHRATMSAADRVKMLLDKLWETSIVLNAVLKQRKSRQLLAAKDCAEALLREFSGPDADDEQTKGYDGEKIHDEIERRFNAMVNKMPPHLKNRFTR